MAIRQRHLLALLLSAAAHAGAILVVASGGTMTGNGSSPPPPANRLSVRVLHSGALPAPLSAPAHVASAPTPPPGAPRMLPHPTSPDTLLPIPAQAGIRYFQPHELTELPSPERGMRGRFLVVPGVPAQTIKVTLSIDDLGYLAWVDIEESELSDEEQHRIRQALFNVRFWPGKIGRIAVRTQVDMEIMIDTEMRY